jgi:cytochrome P450
MQRDPRTYNNPETFNPSRFLGPHPEPDPRETFGFGRRICPGRHLAEMVLFSTFAKVLATLDISKTQDGAGNEITPVADWVGVSIM